MLSSRSSGRRGKGDRRSLEPAGGESSWLLVRSACLPAGRHTAAAKREETSKTDRLLTLLAKQLVSGFPFSFSLPSSPVCVHTHTHLDLKCPTQMEDLLEGASIYKGGIPEKHFYFKLSTIHP